MAKKEKEIIGRIDKVDLPDFGVENINAKVDTGATRSSLHCEQVRLEGKTLYFKIRTEDGGKEFGSDEWMQKKIRSSNGKAEMRYIIKTKLRMFGKSYIVTFSLTDRSKMRYPLLIGRTFLEDRYIVDVSEKNLSYKLKTQLKDH